MDGDRTKEREKEQNVMIDRERTARKNKEKYEKMLQGNETTGEIQRRKGRT